MLLAPLGLLLSFSAFLFLSLNFYSVSSFSSDNNVVSFSLTSFSVCLTFFFRKFLTYSKKHSSYFLVCHDSAIETTANKTKPNWPNSNFFLSVNLC